MIELDGWVWCDDDHVFGQSIFFVVFGINY